MLPITIKFNAFIPRSLGSSLLSYFDKDSRFNPQRMLNYNEFRQKLIQEDSRGYKWLEEPAHFATNYYCATDNVDFHDQLCSNHSTRLSITMKFDVLKIGNYTILDSVFRHPQHIRKGSDYSQHSGESHRIEAYIRKLPKYNGERLKGNIPAQIEYEGVFKKRNPETSKEIPLKSTVRNTVRGPYFHSPNSSVLNDTSVFEISASAGYPFTPEFITPNIDFKLKIELSLYGSSLRISVNGEHNDFPAYELVIGHKVEYSYNPISKKQTGPTYHNLSRSKQFTATVFNTLASWEISQILNHKNKKFMR